MYQGPSKVDPLGCRLLSSKEAAALIGVSCDILLAHVRAGRIPYIDVGCGGRRIIRRFHPADIEAFVQARRKVAACPSSNARNRHFSTTTSSTEGGGFLAQRDARRAEMRKPSSVAKNAS